MCGIAGLFRRSGAPISLDVLGAMSRAIEHRGPDDAGLVGFGEDAALAHRRLSIIDLSPAGHQPMSNAGQTLWITFNGEIYNFEPLRDELVALGHVFDSRSDTEVVLRGYEQWGPALLPKLNGMFAFAILDKRDPAEPALFLARDRFGQKPIYYAEVGGTFAFASEMKALLQIPDLPRDLSGPALDAYLTFLWVPEPTTILAAVRKLPAAHWMRVTRDRVETQPFWRLELTADLVRTDDEIAADVGAILERAVARTCIADVPVAAFLSGGLDSTIIVSEMARAGKPPIETFSVGMTEHDGAYEGFPDDLKYARLVAAQFGLRQHENILQPSAAADLPKLIYSLDEPMADPAILPLYAMCVAARPHAKVLLSGMGADELLGGYRRHQAAGIARLWRRLPGPLRRKLVIPLAEHLPSAGRGAMAPRARRLKRFLHALDDPTGLAAIGFASWSTPLQRRSLLLPAHHERVRAPVLDAALLARLSAAQELDQMLLFDALVYLPSHNLNYTDKISMAASVEVRAPLLDNELVDYVARLPPRQKVRGRTTKLALRLAARGRVHPEVLARGKSGLGAPIRAWLVGPLAPLVADILSSERVERRGLFDPRAVAALMDELRSGREDTSYLVWALLVLELWLGAHDVEGKLA